MQHAFSHVPVTMPNWGLCAQCGSEAFQNANSVLSKISPKVQSPSCTVHLHRTDLAKSDTRAVKPQRQAILKSRCARAGLFRPAALGTWLGNHLNCPRALALNSLTRCAFADPWLPSTHFRLHNDLAGINTIHIKVNCHRD